MKSSPSACAGDELRRRDNALMSQNQADTFACNNDRVGGGNSKPQARHTAAPAPALAAQAASPAAGVQAFGKLQTAFTSICLDCTT